MKIFVSILLFFGFSAEAATVELRFENIPHLVKEGNLHVRGAQLVRQSGEVARGHLARSYLPRINVSGGTESFKTGTQARRSEPFGEITATVNVFHGGRDLLENNAIDIQTKIGAADFEQAFREEVGKARKNYWHLVAGRELRQLLEETIKENRKNLQAAQARIRAGRATETDWLEFEMHRIELDQDLARLDLSIENAERELAVLLGLADGAKITTPFTVDHDHSDELLTDDYRPEDHPEVRSSVYLSERASVQAARSGRWWTPSVDLYAGYGLYTFREREFEPESERAESVFGVRLTLDLFDGGFERAVYREKTLEAAGLKKESQQMAKELQAKIEGAKAELKLTHELIHQSEEALRRAKTYLVRTLDEYRRGVKNSPDVLSASDRNFAMRRRFVELRRDYQLARSELLAIVGK